MTDNDSTIPLRKCTKCGQEFPFTSDYFYRDKRKNSGFGSHCKACVSKRMGCNRRPLKPHVNPGEKICTRCRSIQSVSNFARATSNPDGLYHQCKDCVRKRQGHDKRIVSPNVREGFKWCNKCKRELPGTREYFGSSKDRQDGMQPYCRVCIQKRSRAIRQRDKQKIYERVRRYRESHPTLYSLAAARRRARKRSLPDTFSNDDWLRCLDYFHNTCAVCGNQLRDLFGNIEPHADHWIALSNPECPGTVPDNMICLCSSCNLSKQARNSTQWIVGRFGKHKAVEVLKRINLYFEWIKQQ
jgi:hypothetical protein